MNTGRRKSGCPSDEDLSAYVDGELAGEARWELARHLETCSRCRKQAQKLERTSAGLRRLFDRAAREIDASASPAGRSARVRVLHRWLLAGLAAAAIVLVVVTVLLRRSTNLSRKVRQRSPGLRPRKKLWRCFLRPRRAPCARTQWFWRGLATWMRRLSSAGWGWGQRCSTLRQSRRLQTLFPLLRSRRRSAGGFPS